MKYTGQSDFSHHQQPKIGVLITNLGTPEAPTTKALRIYLAQFLADPRVVEVPRLLWQCCLKRQGVVHVKLHAQLTHFNKNLHLITDPPQNYAPSIFTRH